MPVVFVSSKLSSFISLETNKITTPGTDLNFRDGWNAHLFNVNRRKCIIVTNKSTLYSFIQVGIFKKDLVDFSDFFWTSLKAQLRADGLYDVCEESFYTVKTDRVSCKKTDNDKKVIGSMNDFIYQLEVGLKLGTIKSESSVDTEWGVYVNDIPMSLIKYKTPKQAYLEMKSRT